MPRLGLVIVDEEHDSSYKQQEGGFRYSARDLALLRGQRARVPVVLGSATPSFESLLNVAQGRSVALHLPERAGNAQPPRLSVIDMRAHPVHKGLSAPLLRAMERHLEAGAQVLLYLNRRGYAPTLLCTGCGWVASCASCDARLTVHQRADLLACHHCGAQARRPERCPRCGYGVQPLGQGTERIEETLAERFPGLPVERFDRDNLRGQQALESAIGRVHSGTARILVGTQMLTKGHHFEDVSLVGILNADQSLFSTDFRATERLAQTIVQVAGRAGRAERPGEVLIQSQYPGHPLLLTLLEQGYSGFAANAMAERAQANWPPYLRMAVLRASHPEREGATPLPGCGPRNRRQGCRHRVARTGAGCHVAPSRPLPCAAADRERAAQTPAGVPVGLDTGGRSAAQARRPALGARRGSAGSVLARAGRPGAGQSSHAYCSASDIER